MTERRRTGSKTGFSLAELIVAIALLSAFGVIAARMYFVSSQVAEKTTQLDRAVVLATSRAEAWQAAPADDSFADYSQTIYLDRNMRECPQEEATFGLHTVLTEEKLSGVWILTQTISRLDAPGDVVYHLRAARFIREGVS